MRLTSAKSGEGMVEAARIIHRERQGRDVFILGAANVGKSYFIGSFLEHSFGGKPRRLPISSPTPGTTLSPVAIEAFGGGSKLYDTPGIHLQHRLSAQLLPRELKAVLPRGRMRPHTPQQLAAPGSTFFWGGLARFDIRDAPSALRLTFCAHNLTVHYCPDVAEAEAHYRQQANSSYLILHTYIIYTLYTTF